METNTITRPQRSAQGRLSAEEAEHYFREGYVIHNRPVFTPERHAALRDYFDGILADLPGDQRPEAMDVPHFMHPKLLEWAFDPAVLKLVEPIVGPDIALYSSHFICKPTGNGKRVPWHEDSAYWKGRITPMEVCTVWFAIDPSTRVNGCMMVIPRTHIEGQAGFSDYDTVDQTKNVFGTEIKAVQRDDSKRVYIELQPNECSLHDARIMHGSEANTSSVRRCGWTMRFTSTKVKFNQDKFNGTHVVYLAQGKDHAGNTYADPTRAYPEVLAKRGMSSAYKNSPLKLLISKSPWEIYGDPLEQCLGRIADAAYDAVEINLFDRPEDQPRIQNALRKTGLPIIVQIGSRGETVNDHLCSLRQRYEHGLFAEPLFFNCHTGRDHFSFDDNLRVFEYAAALSARHGVPIRHETHRGRALFSLPVAMRVLQALPETRLTADLSHWFCVHESDLSDQESALCAVLDHVDHVHARVGFSEGPQVSDPRNPLHKPWLDRSLDLWRRAFEAARTRGDKQFTMTPEFGPVGYMPLRGIESAAVADAWEVNAWMRDTLRDAFGPA